VYTTLLLLSDVTTVLNCTRFQIFSLF